jgi:hypothetical protein
MKNLHLISTDKPSRLILQNTKLLLSKYKEVNEGFSEFNQNIYITNDEEIKEGDWKYNELGIGSISKATKENIGGIKRDKEKGYTNHLYKIILTTDQDLIKDGVQAIDDEFLEWFVENPSCEEVETLKYADGVLTFVYQIIIPVEEPKQETLEDIKLEVVLESSHCQFSVVENKLATIYRNQEKILTAIKLLNNGK